MRNGKIFGIKWYWLLLLTLGLVYAFVPSIRKKVDDAVKGVVAKFKGGAKFVAIAFGLAGAWMAFHGHHGMLSMATIIPFGQVKKHKAKGRKISGILAKVYLQATNVNYSQAYTDFLPFNLPVKLRLIRGGRPEIVMQTTLGIMNGITNFKDVHGLLSMPASNGYATFSAGGGFVLQAAGAAAKEILMIPYKIDFSSVGCFDLSDDDELEVEFTTTNITTANVDTAASFMDITDEYDEDSVELMTPFLHVEPIIVGMQTGELVAPEGVTGIYLLNLDKTGYVAGSQVLDYSTITSKQHNHSEKYIDVLAKQFKYYALPGMANQRGQSVILYEGAPLDDVRVNLQLIAANVTANNNFIVAIGGRTNASQAIHSVAKRAKALVERDVRVGTRPESSAAADVAHYTNVANRAKQAVKVGSNHLPYVLDGKGSIKPTSMI